MHTLKLARLLSVTLVFIAASAMIVGCGSLPFVSQPTRAAQSVAPTSTPAATATPGTTPTLVMPPTPVVPLPTTPPTPLPAPTLPPLPNLSAVKLTTKDLPGGFQETAADNRSSINLTDDALNAMFKKIGAQARVRNLVVLQHPQRAQVVAGFLIYPLTGEEKAALETQLANAENALKEWGSALVGEAGVKEARPLASADKFGDKSVGFTTTLPILGTSVRAEAVMMVRASVVQVVMSFYPDPVPPAISTVDLAKVFDARLTSALTGK